MLKNIKELLKKYFSNFYYFYSYLRYRIFALLGLSILVGILDGFGITMFLPLLQFVANQSDTGNMNLGNLTFILDAVRFVGLELNLTIVLLVMLFFFILKGIFNLIEGYLSAVYIQFFIRNVREICIRNLSDYSFTAFTTADAGRIQNTMSGEIQRVVSAYRTYMTVIKGSVTVIIYAGLAFLANPQFAFFVLIGSYATNIIFRSLYRKTEELSRLLVADLNRFQGLLIQQVAHFKYLKATGLIIKYSSKLIEKAYDLENSQKKLGIISAILISLKEPMIIAVFIVVLFIEINFLGGSLGLVLLSVLFFYRALSNIIQVQTAWNQFLSFLGSLENLREFIAELQRGREKTGKTSITKFNQKIILNQLGFGYLENRTLNKVNLVLNKNETIGFVGDSGSGKTTLMNLICGLLKPDSGQLLIDDIPYSELSISSYSSRIGYVTQEPVIFDDTIFNNVSFWSEKNSKNIEKCYEALRKACIYDFVLELGDKVDSRLGNNGINLSGGQKQRISIARELFKDIDILIMDEATSNLDSETEKSIQNNIDALKGKYTILIVAHRLSTVKNADRIVVMNKGMITHIGTYEKLMVSSLDFKKMVTLQEL